MSKELIIKPPAANLSDARKNAVRFGSYRRKSDGARIQRFRCRDSGKVFSDATYDLCYGQKKRQHNRLLCLLLVSGVSQRRSASILRVNRKTIVRKFLFMGLGALRLLPYLNSKYAKVKSMEFDDLETFEHTKLKPLSLIMAVESKTRRILGFRVSSMAAKGLLAKKSVKKYGRRKDERRKHRNELFEELKPFIDPEAVIKSDQNPHYEASVKKYFKTQIYETTKGRRGCVTGQGELKSGGFDPLFSLNHTYAMLRANINRLFRKTWCTTKKKERLALHVALYSVYHNLFLIN